MDFNIKPKNLVFDQEAREVLLKGVRQLSQAVSVTMGPGGLNVVIERPGQVPILTKDGVTVAKAVNLPDKMENLGVQLVKEAAQGAADIAGDGTTTATVLAHSIFSHGLRAINAGNNPVKVRNGIKHASGLIIDGLYQRSKEVKSNEEIIQVGTISANGESEIGKLICEAMEAVGRDGTITVEEAKGFKTSLLKVEGTRINRGFLSPYFINDKSRNSCIMAKPVVLLANRSFSTIKDLIPILEKVHQANRPFLIIAEDVDGEALNACTANSQKGILNICVIRAPEFGQGRIYAMDDLAKLLGTKVITPSNSSDLTTIQIDDLGKCEKIIISRNETIIVGSNVEKSELKKHCKEIKSNLENSVMTTDEEAMHRRRLSRLSGGVAVLRVGGSTEAELRERKDRVEDALYATRAAVNSGILDGGGSALLRVSKSIKAKLTGDELIGFNIVKKACEEPIRQISKNAGEVPDIIVEKTLSCKSPKGFDARKNVWVNLFDQGVIDPTLVVVSALKHATSAADNLLSVACAMHSIEDNTKHETDLYE
ncbi:MAG: chaperonin GroL [Methylococcaceae bacterium TMED69]|nr:MAG: chaperonin GroL [Methylococcaceae bacterium TMED69]|tara:strand:- start:637 stop:2256 length:1620 start_codon:yes stop_codon:yes gene_type:complete